MAARSPGRPRKYSACGRARPPLRSEREHERPVSGTGFHPVGMTRRAGPSPYCSPQSHTTDHARPRGRATSVIHGEPDMTVSSETLRSISTPERFESRLGTLEFVDGVPTRRDRRARLRPTRLRARAQRVPRRVCGGVDVRDPQGLPRGGCRGQRDHHLLGADGLGVGVSDRERRHRLLPGHRRSDVGADGRRDASAGARGVRRHVVAVDRRLRPAGPGSRRGRPVPARPTRLRRPAARQRLPRRAFAHDEGAAARPVVHGGRRPGADRRADQAHAEALSLRRRAAVGTSVGDAARGAMGCPVRRRRFPRRCSWREREGVQHGPAERLRRSSS